MVNIDIKLFQLLIVKSNFKLLNLRAITKGPSCNLCPVRDKIFIESINKIKNKSRQGRNKILS